MLWDLTCGVISFIFNTRSPQEAQPCLAGERRVSAVVTQNGQDSMQARLERLVEHGVESGFLADLAVTIWHRVDAVLSSVFGRHGVSALFVRSLHLARAKYPWLEEVRPGTGATVGTNDTSAASDFASLRAALAKREPSLALEANGWLLKTFCDLLARLLGEALSQKLLQPVWRALPISNSNSNTNSNHSNHNTIGSAIQDAFQ